MGGSKNPQPADCPECGEPVRAIPGYEDRTTYCGRACEDRAFRKRRKARYAEAEEIIRDLHDPGDCWFDHHGYCQEHAWLEEGMCPHRRARDWLAQGGAA